MLGGDDWSVGGVSDHDPADICVRADWARRAGRIRRQDDDYFWINSETDTPLLITDGQTLPIPGSAAMKLTQPSPLCRSATVSLGDPHRFVDHVDGVVLVSEALLIGPDADCHIRSTSLAERVVLTQRESSWHARAGLTGEFAQLSLGQRLTLPSLTMTLEVA